MKSNRKTKTIIILGILFAFSPIFINNLRFTARNRDITSNYNDEFDHDNLKISAVSGPIYIDDNNPSSNWSVAKDAGICTGNGTYSEPYVIEDLIIDGEGLGSCILIENSNVCFRIENCTVYNSGSTWDGGIKLYNVNNSQLTDNNCSTNNLGISLVSSNNNTISENIANYNIYGIKLNFSDNNAISGNTVIDSNENGIYLFYSDTNTISGNTIINSFREGIYLWHCKDTIMLENKMNECGLGLSGYLTLNNIDTTNLVNGKPLYYYTNEINLGSDNFTNAGQAILVNCHNSSIVNLNTSYGSTGILLYYCDNNYITGNIVNYNNYRGIRLSYSDNNTIFGNTLNYNQHEGIYLYGSNNNYVSENIANYNFDGLLLWYCNNIISLGNTFNANRWAGLRLRYSNNNSISGNTANNNIYYGIYLSSSDYTLFQGNTLIGNDECIVEENCQGNTFSDNGSCTYGQGDGTIPGFNLFFMLGILSVAVILISKKLQKS